MRDAGFTITKVVVQGAGKLDAVLEFGSGLNVVAGASNTGKTYAWQLIDFMLGSSKPPKSVPSSAGYEQAFIELARPDGEVQTFQRSLAGGGAVAYPTAIDDVEDQAEHEVLGEQHAAQNPLTISGRLLAMCGLTDKQIRKNKDGVKRSLSFRDVALLAFVDEERIIAERSPALSGIPTADTEKKSALWLLLTGLDDSSIVAQEAPKDRKNRITAELSVLERLLAANQSRFDAFRISVDDLPEEQSRVARAIDSATSLVATRQHELDEAAAARDEVWQHIQSLKSEELFLTEQVSRLELLGRHYDADKSRLESSLEAGMFFEQLPGGQCPVCGYAVADATEASEGDQRLREFRQACAAELDKIAALALDLDAALDSMGNELRQLREKLVRRQGSLDRANEHVSGLLHRDVAAAKAELSTLLKQQSRLSEAAYVASSVSELQDRYSVTEESGKAKRSSTKVAPRVGTAGMVEFCKVVEETLRAWKFPFEGSVSWSEQGFDLVIGNENRGGMGKGFRAVTHAAFTVAVMRYCRQKELPHPGVVMIDSPLNPFKGADAADEDRVNTEVQEAFYADLAADRSGDQFIVFENTEPPAHLRDKMQYTHFSGNAANPRAGFFPVSSADLDDGIVSV